LPEPFDRILRGGTCVLPSGVARADLGLRDGRIAAIGDLGAAGAGEVIDATGLHVLPGLIDPQVHFREPGFPAKEDLESGSRAAVLGGVTSVFEMPNTLPPTTNAAALEDKLSRARGRMWCDHAFFVGATPENAEELGELERLPGCAGVKVFMGKSTGNLLVHHDADLRRVLASGRRRVAVHAEDEERLEARKAVLGEAPDVSLHPIWRDVETARRATERLLALSAETGRPVHVLHITTAEELELLAKARDRATVECTPQHLTLVAPECYEQLGTRCQMNPPIRGVEHREALWRAVSEGRIDALGSDHAPHTLEEKARPYPESPSGMTGVQTLLPVMLDHVHRGRLDLERLVSLCCEGPSRVYDVRGKGRLAEGFDADVTLVDLDAERVITDAAIASTCGWTPFDGTTVRGWPVATLLRGEIVMRDGELIGAAAGQPVRFAI
jgi:dihydroorotase